MCRCVVDDAGASGIVFGGMESLTRRQPNLYLAHGG